MPSGEKAFSQRTASQTADLDPNWIEPWWKVVEISLQEVFGKSHREALEAIARLRIQAKELSEPAQLLMYHDSPLQIASLLAGVSNRELTEQELLAYDKLWGPDTPSHPTREQILQVHRTLNPG